MAEGILGLGSGQAASLNQDLIDKLKSAERKATVEPIETSIEDIGTENEVFGTINSKIDEVLDAIKVFDFFVSGGATSFDQKSATASGDSVVFDAPDVSALNTGITTVDIQQLAQKDVYQSDSVTELNKDTAITGMGVLYVNGESIDTEGMTYESLAASINAIDGVNASFDQVGTDSYRLVLKSSESGLDNALDFSSAPSVESDAAIALGFNRTEDVLAQDGITVIDTVAVNHTQVAQDMQAFVDGVEYNISSNTLEVDGLKISATEEGISSINISKDNTSIEENMNTFINTYNELLALVDEELYSSDSLIEDKAALREVVSQIKNKLFENYGENSDKNVFNYGFELDEYGIISLDSTVFNNALEEDPAGMKELFVGSAGHKGLGTQIKERIDDMGYTDGVIGLYESSLQTREEDLNTAVEAAEEALDAKYSEMAALFGTYSAIITQYESSFSGLSLMIEQSTSG